MAARLAPIRDERTFEHWVVNRFGRRLYEIFFKTYTEKVWGMDCSEISAEWASQRIKNLDLKEAIKSALLGSRSKDGEVITTLIDRFHYPRLGPGMMWERCRDRLAERGVPTLTETRVVRIRHQGGRVVAVTVREEDAEREIAADHVIASMPLSALMRVLDPAPPAEVLAAARRLRYRDFLTVGLIVEREDVFPGHLDLRPRAGGQARPHPELQELEPRDGARARAHQPRPRVLRRSEGDELWSMEDRALLDLGARECETLGLLRRDEVVDGTVIRMPRAYPVYDDGYQAAMPVLREYVRGFANLHVIGRNGQHRYNNQDHSMLAGMLAARNVAGESHDVWSVNVEGDYHEEIRESSRAAIARRRRRRPRVWSRTSCARRSRATTPWRSAAPSASSRRSGSCSRPRRCCCAAARWWAPTCRCSATISTASTRAGAARRSAPSRRALGGFALGFVLGRSINWLVDRHEIGIRRRLEYASAIDPFGAVDR